MFIYPQKIILPLPLDAFSSERLMYTYISFAVAFFSSSSSFFRNGIETRTYAKIHRRILVNVLNQTGWESNGISHDIEFDGKSIKRARTLRILVWLLAAAAAVVVVVMVMMTLCRGIKRYLVYYMPEYNILLAINLINGTQIFSYTLNAIRRLNWGI